MMTNAATRDLPLASPVPRPRPLPFTSPPEVRSERHDAPILPDAPAVRATVEAKGVPGLPGLSMPMTTLPRPQPRAFTTPSGSQVPEAPAGLPAAPETVSAPGSAPNQASLAIVGLNPADTMTVPAPPGSRESGFSAGTVLRPKGDLGGSATDAAIAVPGLLVRGAKDDPPSLSANFSPTSRENLLEAARASLASAPAPKPPLPGPRATRVSSAPDPRLAGRMVYTVAIQMPNVTSHSGSWIVWFAVREPGAGSSAGSPAPDVRPPVPLRKVDPKYIQSAVSDRVEGKVLLSAVIRKDGRVDSVVLLRHLDDRLDRSAGEALAKWAFEPAVRDGLPVVVDAVFEIPFHLAPQPLK
jgi:TonB family protein